MEQKTVPVHKELLHQFTRNKGAVAGFGIIVLFVIVANLAPVLAPHDPVVQEISKRLLPPLSEGHILGTDALGRDMLSRLIYGARISMVIGLVSVGIALIVGSITGLISGYYGGWLDKIVMRFVDMVLAVPYVLLTIVIVAILGPSLMNAMIAIGVGQIPRYVRIMRASVLAEKENDYVLAERALGASNLEIMFLSILPNSVTTVFIQATMGIGEAILSSAALSYLGLGAQPPAPEWGLMIASSHEFITTAWWVVTLPGVAILLAVLGCNLFGDGLRDVLDPRLRN